MVRTFCDVCNRDIEENMMSYLGSKTYSIRPAYTKEDCNMELTLCDVCRDNFEYILSNPIILAPEGKMCLRNRIRFLFKLPITS